MFSEEYGLQSSELQINSVSPKLRTRIWNCFYNLDIQKAFGNRLKSSLKFDWTIEKIIGDRIGLSISSPFLVNDIEKYLKKDCEWYEVYDFVDIYLDSISDELKSERSNELNKILQEEKSAYRIVDCKVVPLVDEMEIRETQRVVHSPYESVSKHTKKALDLFSNRTNPDYENSIKESISAVESMCCIITGETGKSATLNKTIKKLKDKGVHIHGALESAFISLYGYTSDEDGIRHGSIDFTNASFEDAKYMLVSCSAFVNYLIAKWEKTKNNG